MSVCLEVMGSDLVADIVDVEPDCKRLSVGEPWVWLLNRAALRIACGQILGQSWARARKTGPMVSSLLGGWLVAFIRFGFLLRGVCHGNAAGASSSRERGGSRVAA